MINHISIFRDLTLILTMVSIFTILVVTIHKLIRRAAFFQGMTAVLVAVSLSVLFLVALSPFLSVPVSGSGNAANSSVGYFYLLPGISLAVAAAVVFSQVLLLASRIPSGDNPLPSNGETDTKESGSLAAKPTLKLGRPKKTESKSPSALQKPAGKGKNEVKANDGIKGAATT